MTQTRHYFFCGIGGSGMLPLAMIMRAAGHVVEGSDRAHDQGRSASKFEFVRSLDIRLHPQDGSGIIRSDQILVTSTAVEETVPDVQAARRVGARRTTRAELLAELFNAAPDGIAVGGTSGKSTTTAMIGWILHKAGLAPTILNGAVMNNFVTTDIPFANAVGGDSALFVSEVDESDGSIALFRPRIALVNNIAVDHKPLEELRQLFRDFVNAGEIAILNLDNAETAAIASELAPGRTMTYSLSNPWADLVAGDLTAAPDGIAFVVTERASGAMGAVALPVPGRHNVENAMAALATARASGIALDEACVSLATFKGIRRRLEVTGSAAGITIIDDFAHNPDKIAATLATLHEFPGRLLVLFQPHGFGPLRMMKDAFIDVFADGLAVNDILLMPEPVYFGGTVERTVTSADIAGAIDARGRRARALADRAACGDRLLELAKSGDRIVVMGARDDTLSDFAADLLRKIGKQRAEQESRSPK